ncbi:A/G-specific adenine glycosylase [Hyphobacterium sp. HN65]|uniref:Adenine DNA glycosylase n=1 Tax=Hyphobacterium lacteum TaxID=3116575 RepID=A0ABU7LMZ5_9PROT|nr:A/G-specific adenine glycosylase [Hyphobacterium sp. HN65]MEE2525277.1 A/G-specific adenine glycosylase [Hyphobacterium sp. HN65]
MKPVRDLPIEKLRHSLLDWYDAEGRDLPWRIRPEARAAGQIADPYAVWLSEIMLQQTTVPHATPYYFKFLDRWPSVHDLAAADEDEVLAAWAGLGYYARARNLIACARAVSAAGGVFPEAEKDLLALPGIGAYTAAAIRAAAFDLPASVVDGNVERVITRLCTIPEPVKTSKPEIRQIAAEIADPGRPGDYAQAIMDLGATVCTPRKPDCAGCPWSFACAARAEGHPEAYPVKAPKVAKPHKHAVGFAVFRGETIWLRKRPSRGLLGGMLEVPSTEWRTEKWSLTRARAAAPLDVQWAKRAIISHVFTHFSLEMAMWRAEAPTGWEPDEGGWHALGDVDQLALPSLMKKAVLGAL